MLTYKSTHPNASCQIEKCIFFRKKTLFYKFNTIKRYQIINLTPGKCPIADARKLALSREST